MDGVTTTIQVRPSISGEQYRQRLKTLKNINDFPRIPVPVYRHAAPSAPWPWTDLDTDASDVAPVLPGLRDDSEWSQYPQNLFGNWTYQQVNRSEMLTKCSDRDVSTTYKIRVFHDGSFDKRVETRIVHTGGHMDLQTYWDNLQIHTPGIRVQALFVQDMTLPVLQMLGTRYNVEPFFFASSVKWIPSRYQEDANETEDHITVILPFIRVFKNESQQPITRTKPFESPASISTDSQLCGEAEKPLPYMEEKRTINTQAPLFLQDNKILLQDLLSLHLVRKTTTSTIISYHPSQQGTSAKRLQSLVQRTGDSVYWSKIFKRSKDPTLLLLATLWYALYAWDEAFDVLYHYINTLEYKTLESNDVRLTRELHKLQAHLLYYQQLLEDFLRSVEFVKNTPSPTLNVPSILQTEREDSAKLLQTEADNLISEIQRLMRQSEMLSERLDNAILLTFATMDIKDSKAMQGLAEEAIKDSAAIKQIAYLIMFFLPATCLANVFSMNVREINPPSHTTETLAHYILVAVCLTLSTSWLVISVQRDSSFYPKESGVLRRALWPLFYAYSVVCGHESANRHSLRNTRPLASNDEEHP